MTRPLSKDIRERVVTAVADGASTRAVAARFGVAVSSVVAPQACACAASRVHRAPLTVHHGAAAASDVARLEGPAGCEWGENLAQCDLAVPAARGTALQKNTVPGLACARRAHRQVLLPVKTEEPLAADLDPSKTSQAVDQPMYQRGACWHRKSVSGRISAQSTAVSACNRTGLNNILRTGCAPLFWGGRIIERFHSSLSR
jgi:hypothetical protein